MRGKKNKKNDNYTFGFDLDQAQTRHYEQRNKKSLGNNIKKEERKLQIEKTSKNKTN